MTPPDMHLGYKCQQIEGGQHRAECTLTERAVSRRKKLKDAVLLFTPAEGM
jgi:hypothetical protein